MGNPPPHRTPPLAHVWGKPLLISTFSPQDTTEGPGEGHLIIEYAGEKPLGYWSARELQASKDLREDPAEYVVEYAINNPSE